MKKHRPCLNYWIKNLQPVLTKSRKKVIRSVSELITMSPDAKTSVATFAALSPEEAAKYQTDSAFRAQVDQFVKDKLDDLGQVAATKLLSQIATTGKPPEQDAIDKLFSDKLNETEGKDAIANIEAVLQDPAMRQKLAGPEAGLTDVEKQLKKTIEGYIDAATPDSPSASYGRYGRPAGATSDESKDKEYLQALYQSGRLTVDQKLSSICVAKVFSQKQQRSVQKRDSSSMQAV